MQKALNPESANYTKFGRFQKLIFMIGPNGITNFTVFDRFITRVPHEPTSIDTNIERNPFQQPQKVK